MCIPRCLCEEGYLRNSDGECVAPSECPAQLDSKSCEKGEKRSHSWNSKSNKRKRGKSLKSWSGPRESLDSRFIHRANRRKSASCSGDKGER